MIIAFLVVAYECEGEDRARGAGVGCGSLLLFRATCVVCILDAQWRLAGPSADFFLLPKTQDRHRHCLLPIQGVITRHRGRKDVVDTRLTCVNDSAVAGGGRGQVTSQERAALVFFLFLGLRNFSNGFEISRMILVVGRSVEEKRKLVVVIFPLSIYLASRCVCVLTNNWNDGLL